MTCVNCKKEPAVNGDFCHYCWSILDAHYCCEWDGMQIDKTWYEYQFCTCEGRIPSVDQDSVSS